MLSSETVVLAQVIANHNPRVLIVDEITTYQEARAIEKAARRGIAVIATCHGSKLSDVLGNNHLRLLLGEMESVTLSNEVANA